MSKFNFYANMQWDNAATTNESACSKELVIRHQGLTWKARTKSVSLATAVRQEYLQYKYRDLYHVHAFQDEGPNRSEQAPVVMTLISHLHPVGAARGKRPAPALSSKACSGVWQNLLLSTGARRWRSNGERARGRREREGSLECWTIRQFQDHEALNQSRQGTLIKQPGPAPPTNPHRAIKSIPSKTLWNLSGENHGEKEKKKHKIHLERVREGECGKLLTRGIERERFNSTLCSSRLYFL